MAMGTAYGAPCPCGRVHPPVKTELLIGQGARRELPGLVRQAGARRVLVLYDAVTHQLFGQPVEQAMEDGKQPVIHVSRLVLGSPGGPLEVDEEVLSLGRQAVEDGVDYIIGVGTGAINDLGKYLAAQYGLGYASVATAPSMDGFSSPISAMMNGGAKVTLPSKVPDGVIGDLDFLLSAPASLLSAGFGDILGKLTSLRDWEMAHLVLGEYWCRPTSEAVEDLARRTLAQADGIKERSPQAVAQLMESVAAMGLSVVAVGNSRPTSGSEHLIAHFIEQWALNTGRRPPLHGHTVGVATLLMSRLAQQLLAIPREALPDHSPPVREQPQEVAHQLGLQRVPDNFGFTKFDPRQRAQRLAVLRDRWPQVQEILRRIPPPDELQSALSRAGAPTTMAELGIDPQMSRLILLYARYVRERYTLLDVAADVGLLESFAAT